ncbi:MAG TPA: hypothetical protein VMW25_00435 [Clostridia bacterium]|nr:hypothetical protein [Clostridia bacterium]
MTLSADIAPAILTANDLNLETLNDPYWEPLKKSGFNIELHLENLRTATSRLLQAGKTWPEAVDFCKKETVAEVRGFWQEFLRGFSVLPIPIEKRQINGKEEIVVSYSEEELFLDAIDEEEREGVVKASFIQITEFLKIAPEGSMVILVSPPGWSNLKDGAGRSITHLETHIYSYCIKKGEIEALTIVTDNSLEVDKDLVSWLSGQEYLTALGERERIKGVVGSPIFFNGDTRSFSFEQLLEEIEFVKGSCFARGKITFAELRKQLAEKDHLLEGNQVIKTLIVRLEKDLELCLVDPSANSFIEVGKKIADALVGIHTFSTETGSVQEVDWHYLDALLSNESRRYQAMEEISTLTGCSGGGVAMMIVWGPTGPRLVSVEKSGSLVHCGKKDCPNRNKEGRALEPGENCSNAKPT